jgi:hypothetical protein
MNADGRRLPPSKGGPGTFCFTNPELIQFVADTMVYCSGSREVRDLLTRMVPSDGSTFCQCERCTALCQPIERPAMAYCAGDRVTSGPYYYFITEVAKRVNREDSPGTTTWLRKQLFSSPRYSGDSLSAVLDDAIDGQED